MLKSGRILLKFGRHAVLLCSHVPNFYPKLYFLEMHLDIFSGLS